MKDSTDSKIKTPIPPFWKEWKRLNPKYNDDITEAHKRLKEMYSYCPLYPSDAAEEQLYINLTSGRLTKKKTPKRNST